MHCEGKLILRSHNISHCLIEVVTKAGLTISLLLVIVPLEHTNMVIQTCLQNLSKYYVIKWIERRRKSLIKVF